MPDSPIEYDIIFINAPSISNNVIFTLIEINNPQIFLRKILAHETLNYINYRQQHLETFIVNIFYRNTRFNGHQFSNFLLIKFRQTYENIPYTIPVIHIVLY